ncbi:MAG: ribonuclease H-like domain-containing protein [Desulfobacterales bacterium]|nr:ribonuclease H-like domain-containing protein [Desulfobacterales bacterium]
MLKNTFQHITGIGATIEKQLWSSGITDWYKLKEPCIAKLSPKKIGILNHFVKESIDNFETNNPCYFSNLLKLNQHWRLFREFRNDMVFLDIETTGLDAHYNRITTIATYDGKNINYYIDGQNLNKFIDDIKKYKVIVTYNGRSFDIPFIETFFKTKLKIAHIDLRYILKSLGFGGGLKGCERSLGICRGDLNGVDGFFAVLLWKDYNKKNNNKALETLLAYNIEDVVNLEMLMVMSYNMKLKDTPFYDTHKIPLPSKPVIPFQADVATIKKIKKDSLSSIPWHNWNAGN